MTGAAGAVVENAPRVLVLVLVGVAVGAIAGYVAGYSRGAVDVVRTLDQPTLVQREKELAALRRALGLPPQAGFPVALAEDPPDVDAGESST